MKKLARILTRLALLVVSLGLGLVVAEAAIRVTDPYGASYYRDVRRYFLEGVLPVLDADGAPDRSGRIIEHRPQVALEFRHFDFFTDDRGYRVGGAGVVRPAAAEGDAEPPTARVLFLGDSVTLGWGVDDEHTWVRRVEAGGRAPDGRPLECLNAGHMGYDSVQEADLMRAWAPAVRPEVVVVNFFLNDLNPSGARFDRPRPADRPQPSEWDKRWFRWRQAFFLKFHGIQGLLRYWGRREESANAADYAYGKMENVRGYPDNWPRCEAAFDDIRAHCEALGARMVLLDHSLPPIPDLAGWAEERGVPFASVVFSRDEWMRDVRNSKSDAHANELGNALIAEKVLAHLDEFGVVVRVP